MPEYVYANNEFEYEAAATLFKEYAAWLNIDLRFQKFEEEVKGIKKMYTLPHGGIILAKKDDRFIGCVAIRKIDDATAEMKRMYVKSLFQHQKIGVGLLNEAVLLAKNCKYKKIRLDTLSSMLPAMELYKKNGFYEIPAYYYNPESTAVYFEKML